MFRVFVSYSSIDLTNVAELRQAILDTGVDLFIAEHSVRPSEHLSEAISKAIAECDLFVLLWSSNAGQSAWVPQEIGKAHSLKKQILPLVLTPGLELPGFIRELKYIPVYENTVAGHAKARALVLEMLDAKLLKAQKDNLVLLGFGALILWAFSQK